jgi:predicted RNase H-like HicB family nuclease
VPDLPGCTSAGKTDDQAYQNAIEAVRLWLEDAEADGGGLPQPRTLQALRNDPETAAALAAGAAIMMVSVVRDADNRIKANLST